MGSDQTRDDTPPDNREDEVAGEAMLRSFAHYSRLLQGAAADVTEAELAMAAEVLDGLTPADAERIRGLLRQRIQSARAEAAVESVKQRRSDRK